MSDEHASRANRLYQNLADIIDVGSKLASTIAMLIGGWWAYEQFNVQRTNAENLFVSLASRVVASDTDSPVLIVDITLKNIGKVPVWAGKRVGDSGDVVGEGLELTVIEYEDRSEGESASQRIIDWDKGGGEQDYIVDKYNLIGSYYAYRNGSYMLNPGVEYHEAGAVPVTPSKLYAIRVRFFGLAGWTAADFDYVYVPNSE
jgi:hypothetical protein